MDEPLNNEDVIVKLAQRVMDLTERVEELENTRRPLGLTINITGDGDAAGEAFLQRLAAAYPRI